MKEKVKERGRHRERGGGVERRSTKEKEILKHLIQEKIFICIVNATNISNPVIHEVTLGRNIVKTSQVKVLAKLGSSYHQ